ncbi:caspase-12-like [Dromiciops gliroides]|uniref:caspase-12-like n=1 Tax=Dromiciops gliroides TaxID=33562 RepID=UPI001CC62FBB|nr:caspase-12-like [Dromiciops gliroides]XP_043851689.1 caspase-12-like [Dromiciops gliroides]
MAEEKQIFYPLKIVKCLVSSFIDGVIDDLIEKDVLSPNEVKNLEKEFTTIMDQSEGLVNTVDDIIQGSKIIMKKMLLSPLQANSGNEREDKALVSFKKSETMDHILSVLQTICNSPGSFQNFRKKLSSTIVQFFKKLDSNAIQATAPPNQIKLCRPDFYHGLKEAKEGEIYPVMEKGNRARLALIICNIMFDYLDERHGAHLDIWGMWKLLENLGYSVVVKTNLTAQEMESVLKEFADRPEHWSSDSTFLVFMSHGMLNGICGRTHTKQEPDLLATDTIFQIFNDASCPSLKGKPKVIIIQACRGEKLGITYVMDTSETSADTPKQPLQDCTRSNSLIQKYMEKDFISFCSTTPHNVSWRVDIMGSVFINELIYCFQQYAWCCHLEEVFRKVQKSFEIPKTLVQMPTIERLSMSRYFYLFPGI